jgi:predicted signal transduction protein with EAL and GGDEF domain
VRGRSHTTASIGLSRFPLDGDDSTALMRSADMAMYHAKSCGRNRFEFFEPQMNHAASAHLAVDLALHNAVEAGQMAVHYQPQVRVDTGAIVAAEALLRWHHPTLGLVAPSPSPKTTGHLADRPLGATQALAQCAVWRHTRPRCVAVNVSAVQLYADDFVDTVLALWCWLAWRSAGTGITESTAMRDPSAASCH